MSVRVFGPIWHRGIVSDRWCEGAPMVISNSRRAGRVTEESMGVFTGDRQSPVMDAWRYPTDLLPHQILARARARLGRRWSLLEYNCEHFVSDALGKMPTSPQLKAAFGLALSGGVLIFVSKGRA